MRGEYCRRTSGNALCMELPPRARRILFQMLRKKSPRGTTSACAENTNHIGFKIAADGNYLRVRGEYSPRVMISPARTELPPRARRIRSSTAINSTQPGTTSACAENTAPHRLRGFAQWNYLRVRGEYASSLRLRLLESELPPRARRIPQNAIHDLGLTGTTSACAENTLNELGLL